MKSRVVQKTKEEEREQKIEHPSSPTTSDFLKKLLEDKQNSERFPL